MCRLHTLALVALLVVGCALGQTTPEPPSPCADDVQQSIATIARNCGNQGGDRCSAACQSNIDAILNDAEARACLDAAGYLPALETTKAQCSAAATPDVLLVAFIAAAIAGVTTVL
jgi:hypothetical protein